MKYIPIKLQQHFQEKWTLKEKWAVMWHIPTLEIEAKNAELFGIMRRTHFLNPVANSYVLKLDQVFRDIVCETKHSYCCLLWYRSGLKVLGTSCCDWVTVTETNWGQSRFSESQPHRVAEMFVFWFCSLISDCTLTRGMGMEQNTGHSLWKGRKCNSRMFTVHFLQPSCLLSGLGLCWIFLPHAIFPLPNVCLSWHTK